MGRTSSPAHYLLFTLIALGAGCDTRRGVAGADLGPIGPGYEVGPGNGASCGYTQAMVTSNLGTDFYVPVPYVQPPVGAGCFAVFLTNTASTPISVGVEFDGASLDAQTFAYIPNGTGASITYAPLTGGMIPPGEVAILFLNRGPAFLPPLAGTDYSCPPGITAAITDRDAATGGTAFGKAFHITTSGPVAAYDIYPYGGGQSALTSATMLLPTSAWDSNYIAVDAIGAAGPFAGFWIALVGQQDGTKVSIRPSADIGGGNGVDAAAKGMAHPYVLNRGQVLQFVQDTPLVGSVIQSTAPIGVWGGKAILQIDTCCNDSAHQQIPPVRAFGSEYVGVRYRNRYDGQEESPPWRLVGAVDGTMLSWDPAAPSGAPTTLAQGQVASFRSAGPFIVRSQDPAHPFYMAAHMTGAQEYDPGNDGRGDAEFVNVVPTGEYAPSYVFFTDPTYPETNLVLVRQHCDNSFSEVTLDCAGAITGWKPIGTLGIYEYARIDLVRHNFEAQGSCNNGRHEIHSDRPFALTVWGWGSGETGQFGAGFYSQYVSYAYPGGANLTPINDVVVIP